MYISINVQFNSSHFSNKKKHSSLEISRALKLGFILRVPIFTHFCSGFQCAKSSYEGHFAMCSLYVLLFMIYFMGFKQHNTSGKSGCFKMIWTVLWSPFWIRHHRILYTYSKCRTTYLPNFTSSKTLSCCLSCQVLYF